jgi:transcriptional regulator with XRE-family HTH domain
MLFLMTSTKCQIGREIMFKNKNADGTLNLCGNKITELRKERDLSQRALADQMQLRGLDLNKNAIQQIESGQRFVTDIELKAFAGFFEVATDELVDK